ncbi:major facilitator superfamily domain-containing protein [Mycena alexandri]|uniref:Major facilitator superfamily domain-containing protein n=1 Tax=Mycena alexandri TaxID=1745969 RepID=A0AAD6X904_9AGAR|nr:major facilitator superfamily domain-containing protein [Mycena alexandri]
MQDVPADAAVRPSCPPRRPRAFWMSFLAIMAATFLSALDQTAVGTALPTIAAALNDTNGNYIWVGSAYAMASTAFIPLSGSLANAFGRKPIMLLCIAFFAVGSALAGASQRMVRSSPLLRFTIIPGIGGGGILALTQILLADLVPLSERGLFQGLIGVVWAFASSVGPPIGGALSSREKKTLWRWLFYLNLPLSGLAFVLILLFLSVRQPEGSTRSKLAQVDWVGNLIVVLGTGLALVGMTWGGIRYHWNSVEVIIPLVLGIMFLGVFILYEFKVPQHPTVPRDIVGNITSLSGLLTTAAHSVVSMSVIYYLPVLFQASFGASPIRSAVDYLPGSLVGAPCAFLAGSVVTMSKKYRPVNWAGWTVTIVAFGLFSTIREDSAVWKWVVYQILGAVGLGMLFSAPIFPILAPLPQNRAGSALALFSFTRVLFQTWGITISGTILQNMLQKKLPPAFTAQFPPGFEIAYAAIPFIKELDGTLQKDVERVFAESMAVIWQMMIGISGLGLVLSLLMKEVPMGTTVDENYALKEVTAEGAQKEYAL